MEMAKQVLTRVRSAISIERAAFSREAKGRAWLPVYALNGGAQT